MYIFCFDNFATCVWHVRLTAAFYWNKKIYNIIATVFRINEHDDDDDDDNESFGLC